MQVAVTIRPMMVSTSYDIQPGAPVLLHPSIDGFRLVDKTELIEIVGRARKWATGGTGALPVNRLGGYFIHDLVQFVAGRSPDFVGRPSDFMKLENLSVPLLGLILCSESGPNTILIEAVGSVSLYRLTAPPPGSDVVRLSDCIPDSHLHPDFPLFEWLEASSLG